MVFSSASLWERAFETKRLRLSQTQAVHGLEAPQVESSGSVQHLMKRGGKKTQVPWNKKGGPPD